MSERKVDPTGKRALFSGPASAAPDRSLAGPHNDGKDALFSMTPWRPGTVVVECSACHARRRVSLVDIGARLACFSAWVPFGRYPHWMACPSCGHWRWCRVGWFE